MTESYDDPRIPKRIKDKFLVETETNCWLWCASLDTSGYGSVHWNGRMQGAHRVLYEILVGEISPYPYRMELDHLCKVRKCVNPEHMEPVLFRENIRRGNVGENMRSKTHCPQGHPYDSENTYSYKGKRGCKACRNRRVC